MSKKTNGSSPQVQGSHVNSDVGLWIRSRPEPHRGPCLTRQNKHDNLKPLKMRQRNKSSVPVKPWLDNTYSERVAIVFPEGSEKSHLQVYGALVIKCLAVAKQPKVNKINHTFSKSTSLDVVSCLKFSQDFFFSRFLDIHSIIGVSALMSNPFSSPILLDPCPASPSAAQQPCNHPCTDWLSLLSPPLGSVRVLYHSDLLQQASSLAHGSLPVPFPFTLECDCWPHHWSGTASSQLLLCYPEEQILHRRRSIRIHWINRVMVNQIILGLILLIFKIVLLTFDISFSHATPISKFCQ